MAEPVSPEKVRQVRASLMRLQNASDQASKSIWQARDRIREALAAVHAQLCDLELTADECRELRDDVSHLRDSIAYLDEKKREVATYRGEAAKFDAMLDELA